MQAQKTLAVEKLRNGSVGPEVGSGQSITISTMIFWVSLVRSNKMSEYVDSQIINPERDLEYYTFYNLDPQHKQIQTLAKCHFTMVPKNWLR